MTDALKLFVAVPLAPAVAQTLAGAVETLARRARSAGLAVTWAPPVNYHCTLAFLGAARPEAVAAVRERLADVGARSRGFRWRATRLGAFPSADRATVLWAGVEDASGELARLADATAAAMAELGFARDPRPYHPHVTLGGSLGLDIALGVGGCRAAASSRSTGRSLGQDHAGAARDRRGAEAGGVCAFIDAEHALDVRLRPQARRQPTSC
jgi:2'-5' RNA ligase